jgi:hypothetical protein
MHNQPAPSVASNLLPIWSTMKKSSIIAETKERMEKFAGKKRLARAAFAPAPILGIDIYDLRAYKLFHI